MMKIKLLFGFILFSLAVTACRQSAQTTANQNKQPTVSATSTPTVSVNTKIKTYDGKGKVTKINLELGSIELNHEEIKGAMPAMIMEFYVSDKKMLDNLKVGDAVDFVLEESPSGERIISIKKN